VKLAVLIPEWPGQTHVWMWREFVELRKHGFDPCFFSTRRPPPRDAARHAFAAEAEAATEYLWPMGMESVGRGALCVLRHPWRAVAAVTLALRIRDRRGKRSLRNVGLVVAALTLAEAMRASGCRHLYVHSAADSALIARFVGILLRVPYSVVVNANLEWWGGALDEKLGHAAAVIAHARWIHDDILKRVPCIDPRRVVLAPVGVDTAAWPVLPPREKPSTPIRLLSVGRLHPAKGHATVIRVVHGLREGGLDARLTILGGGPMQAELAALISSLGLEGTVDLRGSVAEAEVRAAFAEADVFVLASDFEPLGVVFMEAMAAGVPVIGTRNGGVSEIVQDGRTGLLIDPSDEAAIRAAILRVVEDDALRAAMVTAARARIESAFDSRAGAARVAGAIRATLAPPA
jgi:glycosyltransferase involved in cell wall biosynthesis